jgi:hypothetical protein
MPFFGTGPGIFDCRWGVAQGTYTGISGGTAYPGAIQEVLFEDDDIGMYSEPI